MAENCSLSNENYRLMTALLPYCQKLDEIHSKA